ncbi:MULTISPECIES: cupin-like domain-containing protein [unclassified Janthinobacterium]|uniref:cupin-like domain-containing protein n=1 Tax=unclassified Janthinobacterium TaxID=2610881 RepID=UPI0025B27FC4|nr:MULTISPECIES: cupin-like domain-containing protein [unclassified Janthinobacterium]MDN2715184.1 cupin-like domain-containing protein [Janthinobacterium sp. SUN120]MDO8037425.1 cupin-like domain-containing protein [Janthinobacterium sp. SUN137]MDO8049031.1 cupin-like domain-containing protein [Janthinobacterium sp. SUN211]
MSETVTKVIDLVPGDVHPLATVEAASLTEQAFWEQYVGQHVPVLIKGAAAAWPALQHWHRPGYLESRCGDAEVFVARTFNPNPSLEHAAERRQSLAECIADMRGAADHETFSIPAMDVPQQWMDDIGDYHFLQQHERKPLGYPGKRIFFYKNASTEWHYHQLDETLTCQLAGTKRISLFRLTPANWWSFAPLIKANYHHMSCADRFFPTDSGLTKYEGVLEAGDAVYIPPFWWHGIDAATSEPGITLAQCFRSPVKRFGDWKEPITRELVGDALRMNKLRLLPLLALIWISSISRALKKEAWTSA